MVADKTLTPAPAQDGAPGYGPFHIDLNPTREARLLAQARHARTACLQAIAYQIRVAVTHRIYAALLETGRFLHAHNVLGRGLS